MLFRSIVDLFVLLLLLHCSYIVFVMSCERHFFGVNIRVCTYILHCTHTAFTFRTKPSQSIAQTQRTVTWQWLGGVWYYIIRWSMVVYAALVIFHMLMLEGTREFFVICPLSVSQLPALVLMVWRPVFIPQSEVWRLARRTEITSTNTFRK